MPRLDKSMLAESFGARLNPVDHVGVYFSSFPRIQMEKKPSKNAIVLMAVALVAISTVVVLHADPVQTLIGMLLGVFVLVVVVNGGKKRILVRTIGNEVAQEVAKGEVYTVRVPPLVVELLRQGKEIEAIRVLREATGMGLMEAKNQIDEIHLRIEMGQQIHCE